MNLKKTRGFLRTINFIKNYIPYRASMMEPITNLNKKDQPFVWSHGQNESFKATLAAVANSILCVYPNLNRPFIIYPDASQKYAMGAMLTQMQDGVEQVVSTFS